MKDEVIYLDEYRKVFKVVILIMIKIVTSEKIFNIRKPWIKLHYNKKRSNSFSTFLESFFFFRE